MNTSPTVCVHVYIYKHIYCYIGCRMGPHECKSNINNQLLNCSSCHILTSQSLYFETFQTAPGSAGEPWVAAVLPPPCSAPLGDRVLDVCKMEMWHFCCTGPRVVKRHWCQLLSYFKSSIIRTSWLSGSPQTAVTTCGSKLMLIPIPLYLD